jgi:hypothetical protein
MGFEPTILASKRAKTVHALDRAATVISGYNLKLNSGALVRQRTIPTERLPLVGEVGANFSG